MTGTKIEYARAGDLIPVEFDNRGTPTRYVRLEADEPHQEIYQESPIHLPEAATRGTLRTTSHVEGSHSDRARGFSIATWQLSTVTGIAAWLVSSQLLAYPLLSVTGLLWIVSAYFVVWLGGFLAHLFFSPEGIDLYHTKRMWDFLDREQAERHQRYRPDVNVTVNVTGTGEKIVRAVMAIGLSIIIVFGGLLVLAALGVLR